MGIPGLYRRFLSLVLQRYPSSESKKPDHVFSLHIDANEVIYIAIRDIFKEAALNAQVKIEADKAERKRLLEEWETDGETPNPPEYVGEFDRLLCERTIRHIQSTIEMVRPLKLVHIAFDGIAPIAKINQQRKRRYAPAAFAELSGSSKEDDFDRSVITPGSAFFQLLDKTLLETLPNMKVLNADYDIRYSSYREPGEGEHKIMTFFREAQMGPHDNHVVVASDSDMILLATTLDGHIWVYRPMMKDNAWWSIEWLKRYISIDWRRGNELHPEASLFWAITLLGNDFVPPQPSYYPWSASDHNFLSSNVEVMAESYEEKRPLVQSVQQVMSGLRRPLVNVREGRLIFDWEMIREFYRKVAQDEYERLYFISGTRVSNDPRWSTEIFPREGIPEKPEEWMKKFVAAWYAPMELADPSKTMLSRLKIWSGLESIDRDHLSTTIGNDMVLQYLRAIVWSCRYQILGPEKVTSDFVYPYPYPPLLRTIAKSSHWNDLEALSEAAESDMEPVSFEGTLASQMVATRMAVTPVHDTRSLFDTLRHQMMSRKLHVFPSTSRLASMLDLMGAMIMNDELPEIYTFNQLLPVHLEEIQEFADNEDVQVIAEEDAYQPRPASKLIRDVPAIQQESSREQETRKVVRRSVVRPTEAQTPVPLESVLTPAPAKRTAKPAAAKRTVKATAASKTVTEAETSLSELSIKAPVKATSAMEAAPPKAPAKAPAKTPAKPAAAKRTVRAKR